MPHVDGDDDSVGYGVFGHSPSGNGVRGSTGDAVFDPDVNNVGVYGTSKSGRVCMATATAAMACLGTARQALVCLAGATPGSAQVYMAPLAAIPTPIVRIAPVCLATHSSKA